MSLFADIAFPAAVRRVFTYRIPEFFAQKEKKSDDASEKNARFAAEGTIALQPGMRVWVPLRSQMAIGMVVRIHQNTPEFETREIVRVLDTRPVLSPELLQLTEWIHRFYYCSMGEAIQASLPAGMNFIAEPYLRLTGQDSKAPTKGLEKEIFSYLDNEQHGNDISVSHIKSLWVDPSSAINRLVKKGLAEIWQVPRLRLRPLVQTVWDWNPEILPDSSGDNKSTDSKTQDIGEKEKRLKDGKNVLTHITNKRHSSIFEPSEDTKNEKLPDITKCLINNKDNRKEWSQIHAFLASFDATKEDGTDQNSKPKKIPVWIQAVSELRQLRLPMTRSDIIKATKMSEYSWQKIRKSGLLVSKEAPAPITQKETTTKGITGLVSNQVRQKHSPASKPSAPYSYRGSERSVDEAAYMERRVKVSIVNTLNEQQNKVFLPIRKAIQSGSFQRFVLFGVTGSGKTEVYIHALKESLEQGRGGLMLVPEISLTPQTVERFYRVFGDRISVLHSRLSDRERLQAWTDLQQGRKDIAIGARSALFAPVKNPGIIILDEEHDSSYKQEEPAPRYHARETAVMRAHINNAVIITGSATPSLISLRAAASGKAKLLKLETRHASATLPEVSVLDLREYRNAMKGPLARPLYNAVAQALTRKEQIIILHNRRGYTTFLQCNDCGHILDCPSCSVSLTYHRSQGGLRCHYCGYSRHKPARCPSCDRPGIKESGMGTQKIETELSGLFPRARILRMDQDTTSAKGAHERLLSQFAKREADILMGTQIVAKGLDFLNVTVVGVINSDTELAFPSYRSSERMYQLLSQVAGRSGRGAKAGTVYLQTLMPSHPVFHYARNHDFPGFARFEMKGRKERNFPPYSRLVIIYFRSKDAQAVALVADHYTKVIRSLLKNDDIMGPSPSSVLKIRSYYSWESHIKMAPEKGAGYIERLFDTINRTYDTTRTAEATRVRITINIDSMH